MSKLGILDLKSGLRDKRFVDLFPEYADLIKEYHKNPSCACNSALYQKLLSHKDRLKAYFPTKEIESTEDVIDKLSMNHWKVINCKTDEAEDQLRKLPKGRKQIAVARWQDQVTIVVNELTDLW